MYMLNLRSLHHFVILAERLNYTRAADELGITQPTLTRSIQALERRLGLRLFDRDQGGVHLTRDGERTAERARHILIDASDLERQSRESGVGLTGRVRFGMTPMLAHALLHNILSERLSSFPAVTNEVVVRDGEALWGMLMAGEIEFFASADPPLHDLSRVSVEVLGNSPLCLLVRRDHPLVTGSNITSQFPLVRASWAGLKVPDEVRHWVLNEANIIEDFAVLEKLTTTTDCMWLASAHAVPQMLQRGDLVELFRSERTVELVVCSLKRRSLSLLARAIIQHLRSQVLLMTGATHTL